LQSTSHRSKQLLTTESTQKQSQRAKSFLIPPFLERRALGGVEVVAPFTHVNVTSLCPHRQRAVAERWHSSYSWTIPPALSARSFFGHLNASNASSILSP
jgi:hypothetical protein